MISEKYLPIGTIVKLTDLDSKVMIISYLMKCKKSRIYDYCGCLYPFGVTMKEEILYFNKIDIDKIIKTNFIDEETLKVLDYVEEKAKS